MENSKLWQVWFVFASFGVTAPGLLWRGIRDHDGILIFFGCNQLLGAVVYGGALPVRCRK